MTFLEKYKTELVLFGLSLILHLTLFAFLVNTHGSVLATVRADDGYFEIAENVLLGNGFSWSTEAPYKPNPLRTPGYIYFLSALMGIFGITGAAIVQMLLASLIPVFGLYIARFISHSQKVGLITGIILAVDPTLALLSFQFYTDTLFLVLFFIWTLLTLHYSKDPTLKRLTLSAIVLGVAILVRPVVQYLPILIALCILWQFGKHNLKKSAVHIAVYVLIVGTILTPWIMRNVNTFDSAGISAQTAFVLYTNLAPAVLSVANDTDFLEERETFLTFDEYKGNTITLKNADEYTHKTTAIMREYPAETAYVMSKSLFTFFTIDGFWSLFSQLGENPRDYLPFIAIMKLFWLGVTGTAVIGALRYLFIERTAWALFFALLIPYFALTSTIAAFGTNPRYRLPVDPIILALAGIGCIYARSWIEKAGILSKIQKIIRK